MSEQIKQIQGLENITENPENTRYFTKENLKKIAKRAVKPLAYTAAVAAGIIGGKALGLGLDDLMGISDNLSTHFGRNIAEAIAYRGIFGLYTVATTMAATTTGLVYGVKRLFNRQENMDVLQNLDDPNHEIDYRPKHLERIQKRLQNKGYATQDQITEKGLKYLGKPVTDSKDQVM